MEYDTAHELVDELTCATKNTFFFSDYIGFYWKELKIICSSANEVHEEQSIVIRVPSNTIKNLPDPQSELDQSTDPYDLQVQHNPNRVNETIISNDQSIHDYLSKNNGESTRRIYIWFPDYPIICQIEFNIDENTLCSTTHTTLDNVVHRCYYSPGSSELPTKEEMDAEFEQYEKAEKPPNTKTYVLDLEKPEINPNNPSDDDDDDDDDDHGVDMNRSTPSNIKKPNSIPKKLSKSKKRKKILAIIFGILLLVILIGGFIFYMIRKKHLKNTSSSMTNLEDDDNEGLSTLTPNESNLSLSVVSEYDNNTEISTNIPSKSQESTTELMESDDYKQQRPGTSLNYDENI